MTSTELFAWAQSKLETAGIDGSRNEVRRLWELAEAERENRPDQPEDLSVLRFKQFVRRRTDREPFSHISGKRQFWKNWFQVSAEVLDPRPDTETLVEVALCEPFDRVLDLGTGSGCILISLLDERAEATGIGTDVSEAALGVARANSTNILGTRDVAWLHSDWFSAVEGKFDLIVSNPPYIRLDEMDGLSPEVRDHEPRHALTDEGDGLSAYRQFALRAPDFLQAHGRLLIEIGYTQAAQITEIFRAEGWRDVLVKQDIDGRDRVIELRVTPSD